MKTTILWFVQLSNNLAPKAKKCKHFLMLLNYIKEQVDAGIINVKHIDTDDNLADILTKLLTGSPFHSKASKLLGHTSHLDATLDKKRTRDNNIEYDNNNNKGKKSCVDQKIGNGHVPTNA